MKIRGQWHPAGQKSFPLDKSIRCDVYNWTAPTTLAKFSIPFFGPVEDRPRRFFCGPVLDIWKHLNDRCTFLPRACRLGARMLNEFDEALGVAQRSLPGGTDALLPPVFP